MFTLIMNKETITLMDEDNRGFQKPTDRFLGNVIAMLEEQFPEAITGQSDFWVSGFLQDIGGGNTAKKIWGVKERGIALYDFNNFVDGRDSFYPTLEEVERLRISHNLPIAPLPIHPSDPDGGLQFRGLGTVNHVLIASLYFYAYYGYCLKRCKLCGKWFAVKKANAQENYCSRKFSYTDCFGKSHEYPTCKDAREKIAARSKRRYSKIYQRLYGRSGFTGELNNFVSSSQKKLDLIKESPSIKNLADYERFLYIECEKLYPRYGRETR